MTLTEIIAKQLGLREKQVESTINLLAQGATIPPDFITFLRH